MTFCQRYEKWTAPPTSETLAADLAPYYLHAIDVFGADRCMFASNFPPDRASCTFTALMNGFKRITEMGQISDDDRAALFHNTAARLYNIPSAAHAAIASGGAGVGLGSQADAAARGFPVSASELTTEFLSKVLGHSVASFETRSPPNQGLLSDVILVDVAYDSSGGEKCTGLPPSVCLKVSKESSEMREFCDEVGFYKRETNFFASLADSVAVRVPKPLYVDSARGRRRGPPPAGRATASRAAAALRRRGAAAAARRPAGSAGRASAAAAATPTAARAATAAAIQGYCSCCVGYLNHPATLRLSQQPRFGPYGRRTQL